MNAVSTEEESSDGVVISAVSLTLHCKEAGGVLFCGSCLDAHLSPRLTPCG